MPLKVYAQPWKATKTQKDDIYKPFSSQNKNLEEQEELCGVPYCVIYDEKIAGRQRSAQAWSHS